MAFNKARAQQEAERLVLQGKTSQGIKQYFEVFERDPSDLALLNTIGDLYIREKNIAEGLKQFYRLAEAYVEEGFTLKAIAIYKKIIKIEPNPAGSWLKLGELYQAQGLASEAREQYYQAVECFKKKKQDDKALETLRKVVQLDAENATARANLAAFCDQIGRKDEATQIYLETAEQAHRRRDASAAQTALAKAQEIDPNNPRIHLLKARQALANQHPEEVEAILGAVPGLEDDLSARSLLMESYLSTQQLEKAERVALDLFHASPADFTPVASFVSACVQVNEFDSAFKTLSTLADELLEQKKTSPLMESLRLIWSKSPRHLPTLELICRICNETGDEFALPEVLEALGHSYVQWEQFEKAEQVFHKLVNREPDNEPYKALLNQVLQKQGKEVLGVQGELPVAAMAPTAQERLAAPAASTGQDSEREAMVKAALENSDLFLRYHLVKKAVEELDQVLAIYPDEVQIHTRLVEICWKQMSDRAEQAARALVHIYTQRGDDVAAERFVQFAGGFGAAGTEVASPEAVQKPRGSLESLPAVSAESKADAPTQTDPASEFSLEVLGEAESGPHVPPSPSRDMPVELSAPAWSGLPSVPVSGAQEIDLSEDWRSLQARPVPPSPALETPEPATPFNEEDSRIEIKFYLENGFADEANKTVAELERKHLGDPRVAELRALVRAYSGAPAAEDPKRQPAQTLEPTSRGVQAISDSFGEWAEVLGPDVQGLVETLNSQAARSSPDAESPSITQAPSAETASFSDLLEEMEEGPAATLDGDDPETHYQLGVAFREMNLLDEAIGEFQKVVKGTGEKNNAPNFLQACTLLAICFMDKGMAPIAVKWYQRALETPGLDPEVILAIQYDLGVAYEQAGDVRSALEKFTEVYGQNIDFRDVAEKIRISQQKLS